MATAALASGCGLGNDFDRFQHDEVSEAEVIADLAAEACAYALRCEFKFPMLGLGEALCDPGVLADFVAFQSATQRPPLTAEAADACVGAMAASTCDDFEEDLPLACRQLLFDAQPDGAPCKTELSCQSGLCRQPGDLCIQAVCASRSGVGQACGSSADCTDGLFCNDATPRVCQAKADALEPCTVPDGCADGLHCNPDLLVCVNRPVAGEICITLGSVDPCLGDRTCYGMPNPTCQDGASADEPCDGQTPCGANLRCVDGVCAVLVPAGGPCEDLSTCPGGFLCIEGSCQFPPRIGEACDATSGPCVEGVCEDGTCVRPAAFEPCGEDGFDMGRDCAEGTFCLDGTCHPLLGEGEACDGAGQCASSLVCPASGEGAGTCTPCS